MGRNDFSDGDHSWVELGLSGPFFLIEQDKVIGAFYSPGEVLDKHLSQQPFKNEKYLVLDEDGFPFDFKFLESGLEVVERDADEDGDLLKKCLASTLGKSEKSKRKELIDAYLNFAYPHTLSACWPILACIVLMAYGVFGPKHGATAVAFFGSIFWGISLSYQALTEHWQSWVVRLIALLGGLIPLGILICIKVFALNFKRLM